MASHVFHALSLVGRNGAQRGPSAQGVSAATAGSFLYALQQITVRISFEKLLLPMPHVIHCQRSILPFFLKLLRSSHIIFCFANGRSYLVLFSRETGLAVRGSCFPHSLFILCRLEVTKARTGDAIQPL